MAKLVQAGDTGLGRKPLQPNWRAFKQYLDGDIKMSLAEAADLHLVRCYLKDVTITIKEVPADSGWETFRGMEATFLHFEYIGESIKGSEPGVFTHTLSVIDPSTKYKNNNRNNGMASPDAFRGLIKYLAHYDTIALGKSEGYDFDLEIFDDKGIVDVDKFAAYKGEDILKAFDKLFKAVVKRYHDKEGKCVTAEILLWLNLTIQEFNKDRFGVPNFGPQGAGIIERVNTNKIPRELQYDPRNMNIIPTVKPKANAAVSAIPTSESAQSVIDRL
jgi:hypothetical protein